MAKVLIVDDSQVILKMLEAYLKKQHEVTRAVNGQEAYECIEKENFDIMISDINMPFLSGFELAKKVRNDSNQKDLPIIILSTEFSDDIKAEGKEIGINAWMVKPCDEQELLMAVDHLTKK